MADDAFPRLVLVIRHGEKPGTSGDDKDGGPHLSIRGSARAGALPALFIPGESPATGTAELCCAMSSGSTGDVLGSYAFGTAKASSSRLPIPNRLFATASSHASSRPLETITPLAQALQRVNDPSVDTRIDARFTNKPDDLRKLVATVLKTPSTYAGKVVLICWHHGTIPALVEEFGVPKHELAGWDPFPADVFDVVMQISWSGGRARMTVGLQQLLFGDTSVSSGSVTTVLDAPAPPPDHGPDPATPSLPRMFRSCLGALQDDPNPPSVKGLREIDASGSAQFSRGQLVAVLESKLVRKPVVVVDLRQESHGFLHVGKPLHGESAIAVGWFAERDWMNVGKDLPSIELDQQRRLSRAAETSDLVVSWITSKTPEDGIWTAERSIVVPSGFATEREVVRELSQKYLRLPTTDHVRPRDAEVDEFVRFTSALPGATWLHFHCRGGDGRTTTFMVMRDIMRNAPDVPVDDIVRRQHLLGGEDLDKPVSPNSFAHPFTVERRDFVRDFYDYVCAAKPGRYRLAWSAWVAGRLPPAPRDG